MSSTNAKYGSCRSSQRLTGKIPSHRSIEASRRFFYWTGYLGDQQLFKVKFDKLMWQGRFPVLELRKMHCRNRCSALWIFTQGCLVHTAISKLSLLYWLQLLLFFLLSKREWRRRKNFTGRVSFFGWLRLHYPSQVTSQSTEPKF